MFAAKDHVTLLPVPEDRRQLKIERATKTLSTWERAVRSTAVTAVAAACKASDGHCKLPMQDLKGALAGHLTVEVERLAADVSDAHEYPAEILVSINLGGWENTRLSRAAMREVARVVAPAETVPSDIDQLLHAIDADVPRHRDVCRSGWEQGFGAVQRWWAWCTVSVAHLIRGPPRLTVRRFVVTG